MDRPKIGILSLGCPRNLVDSESILSRLNFKKYKIVDMNEAEIGIINTCAFIEDAKNESIEAILDLIELKKEGRLKKIIVYGCLPQRYKERLIRYLPEVDAFVGRITLNHDLKRFPLTPKHYAYFKICEGCLNNCSYCIVPKIKQGFISLDIDSILAKIEALDKTGTKELNIIGQDITGYGLDLYGRVRLTDLIKEIIKKIKNIHWLRLLYLYPTRLNDELLDLIREEPKIVKYVDLPLQHINNRILKLMQRGITKEEILRLIEKIRKKIPSVAIRTSIIVGFPSETEKEFKELLDFIEDVKFERLGAFVYSREEGTAAYNFKHQIPKKIKLERFHLVMSLQKRISEQLNQRFLGKSLEVLIDEERQDGYLGRSQYDAPEVDGLVYVDAKRRLKPGEFVKVKIVDTLQYDLVGRQIK
ncbi:MAG: 30S ribosomal protein S12 methylthiotransferase RimO [Candidatus Omnitrophica bacterium]|nr:30S ribosomal protein S12 methylthiotransferase RimO [Candidatus Omnitrophota bacterium]